MSDISVMTLRENAIIKIKMGEIQGADCQPKRPPVPYLAASL